MNLLSRKHVLTLRRDLYVSIGICVAVVAVVHMAPKPLAYHSSLRLFYTVAYFSALGVLAYLMLAPRRQVAEAMYTWRYADAPQTIERAWRRYLYALDQVISVGVYIASVITSSIGLMLLARWFPSLEALSVVYSFLWWLGILAAILYPLLGGFLFNEAIQCYRTLQEQISTTQNFHPRSLSGTQHESSDPSPLEILPDNRFRGGGVTWKWNDFRYNCVVFGMPGSGKTSCVLNTLLDGILGAAERNRQVPAGLILDPKGDFRGKIRTLCRKYGRESDLLVIDPHAPGQSIRWNPLDSEDDELELASRFAAVLQSLGMENSDNTFWIDAAQRFIRHSICLLRVTNPPGTPPSFRDIQSLASSFGSIADRTDQLDVTDPSLEPCLAFFNEWVEMAPNQRSGIQSHVTNMLDPFLMEPYASMFSGRSTIKISDIVQTGKILYVHMPIADKQEMARTVGTFVKLEFYREVLKALNKDRPSFFLCDEFQQFFTTGKNCGDADFFERSRQSNHANLIATQNLPGLCRTGTKREGVTSLLGNCATKIFLRNTDEETNEFASKQLGEEIMAMGGVMAQQHGGRGVAARAVNQNDQYLRRVPPDVFKDLAVPDTEADVPFCETIILTGARNSASRDMRRRRWPLHLIEAQ